MRFLEKRSLLFFDIETQGLDPYTSALRAYGTLDPSTGECEVKAADRPSREQTLLSDLVLLLLTTKRWGGWNITEFDLAFISVRAEKHGLTLPLAPTYQPPVIGKYGKARVIVPERDIKDLAYDPGEELAENLGVKWSLQDVAQAMGWRPSIEMTGAEAATAPITQVMAHCLDDLSAMAFIVEATG